MDHHDEAARFAQAILHFRRRRARNLPSGLFGEFGWELLLELFVADARGERLTGADVCKRSNTAIAAAERWLRLLSRHGLVVGDGSGDLHDLLTLSAAGLERVERVIEEARALAAAI